MATDVCPEEVVQPTKVAEAGSEVSVVPPPTEPNVVPTTVEPSIVVPTTTELPSSSSIAPSTNAAGRP